MKYLIVGLGNIGEEYAHTRHNIGFDILDSLAEKHQESFHVERLGQLARISWKGKQTLLLKPSTFVNLSGKAVKYWIDKEKIPIDQVLVLVDDLALPLEVLRLKPGGSDAGHNGLKSIQESLGTSQFPKLRFGIGHSYPRGKQAEFVLGRWDQEELPQVEKKINLAVETVEKFVSLGIQRAMSDINTQEVSKP